MNQDRGLNERITFMTDKKQREWLDKQVAETGAPLGEVIRRAINHYRRLIDADLKRRKP